MILSTRTLWLGTPDSNVNTQIAWTMQTSRRVATHCCWQSTGNDMFSSNAIWVDIMWEVTSVQPDLNGQELTGQNAIRYNQVIPSSTCQKKKIVYSHVNNGTNHFCLPTDSYWLHPTPFLFRISGSDLSYPYVIKLDELWLSVFFFYETIEARHCTSSRELLRSVFSISLISNVVRDNEIRQTYGRHVAGILVQFDCSLKPLVRAVLLSGQILLLEIFRWLRYFSNCLTISWVCV